MREDNMRKSIHIYIYIYVWLGRFAVQQKLTEHCNSTIINFLKSYEGRLLREMVFCKELIFLLGKELENWACQWSMGGGRGNPGIWWPGAPILWNTISEKFLRLTLTFFQRSFALISTGFLDALQSWDHINSIHYLISLLSFSFFGPTQGLWRFPGQRANPCHRRDNRGLDT